VVKLATEPGGLKLHLALAPTPLDLHRGSHVRGGGCRHMLDARADREWENWQKKIAFEGRRVANPE
jgi:hypothetical protein